MTTDLPHWDAENQLAVVWLQAHGDDPEFWPAAERKQYECEAAHLRVQLLEGEVQRLNGLVASYRALEMGRQSELEALRKTAPCGDERPGTGGQRCEKQRGHDGCHQKTGDGVVWAWG